MAYAIGDRLLADIRTVIAAYRDNGLLPPAPVAGGSAAPFEVRWFMVQETIPVGGKGYGINIINGLATEESSGEAQAQVGTFKGDWDTNQTEIYDLFLRGCGEGVRKYTLIQCVRVGQKWAYWQGAGMLTVNKQLSATADADHVGADPQLTYLGKTSSAWTKGTWQMIKLYTGTPGSETVVQTIQPTDSALEDVEIRCYNRYVDIDSGKWVRVTGGGELVTAEC